MFKLLIFWFPQVLCLIRRSRSILILTSFVLVVQEGVFAKVNSRPLFERCESLALWRTVSTPIRNQCMDRFNACIDERMSWPNEVRQLAENYCWKRPLKLDPNFVGPCPSYMEELETAVYDSDKSILSRISLRNKFFPKNGLKTQSFLRNDSVHRLRQLLSSDPNNVVALLHLREELEPEDVIGRLTLEMKLHELDPDCPSSRSLRQQTIFNSVNELANNWLTESGPGSELSASERRELLQKARATLLDMYDIAVKQDHGPDRLYWALESIHDAVLTGASENIQEVARQFDIDLENYAERRQSTLVRAFSRDYNVDSEHTRSHVFSMMCNDYAFELGLVDQCLRLLEHYKPNNRKTLASDWAQAAIMLANALTRDCSAHANVLLGVSTWRNVRRCMPESRDKHVEYIHVMLTQFDYVDASAEHDLLLAYLRLNDESDEYYLRALATDASIAPYAARLSKRLLDRGEVEAALNVVSSIDTETKRTLTFMETVLLKNATESVQTGSYSNWLEHPLGNFRAGVQ